MKASIVLATLVTGCFAQVQSSQALLGPEDAQTVLRTTPNDTARELARILGNRGYHLIDQRSEGQTLLLKLGGNREALVEGKPTYTWQFGSVFYARIAPAPEGSLVSIVGAPIVDGAEACTEPPTGMPCEHVHVGYFQGGHVDGVEEANVIHGVYAELALEQLVVARNAPAAPPIGAAELCRRERVAFAIKAGQEREPEVRERMLSDAPTCE